MALIRLIFTDLIPGRMGRRFIMIIMMGYVFAAKAAVVLATNSAWILLPAAGGFFGVLSEQGR